MDAFWSEVSSAQWMANVGIPLAGTLFAIGAAYLVLRRQLKHDRELVQAGRRSEAAREFATEALAVIAAIEHHAPRDPWWQRADLPETLSIYDAQDKAQIILGEFPLIDDITSGIRDIDAAWEACQKRVASVAREDAIAATDTHIGNAVLHGINELLQPVVDGAEALLRWDGHLPMPRMPWPKIHVPARRIRRRREQRERWMEYYARRAEDYLRRKARRRGVRVVRRRYTSRQLTPTE